MKIKRVMAVSLLWFVAINCMQQPIKREGDELAESPAKRVRSEESCKLLLEERGSQQGVPVEYDGIDDAFFSVEKRILDLIMFAQD